MARITVETADGVALAADLIIPEHPRAAVLVAGAMGVPPRYYAHFCDWLAEDGIASIRFSWRGMPGSPAKEASLHLWAEQDLPAVLARLRQEVPGVPVSWLGHSVGGQLFGLMRDPPVDRALFVASQSGWWGHWPGIGRALMWGFWHLVLPTLVTLTGRLPMAAFGQGEDIPAGVAREWARWGRDRRYILSSDRIPADAAFTTFRGPLTLIAIADDGYAPPPTVAALAAMYTNAQLLELSPKDVGLSEIGHFGPFRPTQRTALWGRMRALLVP